MALPQIYDRDAISVYQAVTAYLASEQLGYCLVTMRKIIVSLLATTLLVINSEFFSDFFIFLTWQDPLVCQYPRNH